MYNPNVWPENFFSHVPLSTFHSLAVLSADAVNTWSPLGENTAVDTGAPCPSNTLKHSPLDASNTLAVRSDEAVTNLAES